MGDFWTGLTRLTGFLEVMLMAPSIFPTSRWNSAFSAERPFFVVNSASMPRLAVERGTNTDQSTGVLEEISKRDSENEKMDENLIDRQGVLYGKLERNFHCYISTESARPRLCVVRVIPALVWAAASSTAAGG
ncbi:MAG: hypothetical protein LV481_01205 [Methylacidiphilales bacterium]|nr:hypothetical protein [Candidatus Methylacidiphilales bacterium]